MISVAQPEQSSGLSGALRRHLWKSIGAITLCVGAAVAYTAVSPMYYGSEAKIFVRLGRESVSLDPTATTGQNGLGARLARKRAQ